MRRITHGRHFFMPFYAYQCFLCLSERFTSILCLSANDQKWGILCLSASECLFMIVGPIVVRLMLIRAAIGHLMLVRVWKITEIDLSQNDGFFASVCPDRFFPTKSNMLPFRFISLKYSP